MVTINLREYTDSKYYLIINYNVWLKADYQCSYIFPQTNGIYSVLPANNTFTY